MSQPASGSLRHFATWSIGQPAWRSATLCHQIHQSASLKISYTLSPDPSVSQPRDQLDTLSPDPSVSQPRDELHFVTRSISQPAQRWATLCHQIHQSASLEMSYTLSPDPSASQPRDNLDTLPPDPSVSQPRSVRQAVSLATSCWKQDS